MGNKINTTTTTAKGCVRSHNPSLPSLAPSPRILAHSLPSSLLLVAATAGGRATRSAPASRSILFVLGLAIPLPPCPLWGVRCGSGLRSVSVPLLGAAVLSRSLTTACRRRYSSFVLFNSCQFVSSITQNAFAAALSPPTSLAPVRAPTTPFRTPTALGLISAVWSRSRLTCSSPALRRSEMGGYPRAA